MYKKGILLRLLKIGVSGALIVVILMRTDLERLWAHIINMNLYLFILANLLNLLRVFMSGYRWKILLRVKNIEVDMSTLSKIYFVGIFFNMFLPTALGGDAVRVYYLWRLTGEKVEATSSVVIERVIGFFALGLICLGAIVLSLDEIRGFKQSGSIALLCTVYLISIVMFFNKRIMEWVFCLLRRLPMKRLVEKIERFYMSLWGFLERKNVVINALIISLLYQLAWLVGVMLIGIGIGIRIDPMRYFVFLPIVMVATMIPMSINGIGIREAAFVILFGLAGVPVSSSVLLSFLAFSMAIILGILGGIVYGISDLSKKTTIIETPHL
jgi:uncharacterized protein (TIRG00374 family)